jgi:hypothetical protein
MKRLCDRLPALLATILVGCSTSPPEPPELASRPADFSVQYEWTEGSLPPPHHYEYAITVASSGQGQLVLLPDYPTAGAPKWTERFSLDAEDMDRLYQTLKKNGLFRNDWRQLDAPPVGGSSQTLVVMAGGKQFIVEDYLVADQQPAAKAIYEAVNAIVPQESWDRLDGKRRQYMQKHPRD